MRDTPNPTNSYGKRHVQRRETGILVLLFVLFLVSCSGHSLPVTVTASTRPEYMKCRTFPVEGHPGKYRIYCFFGFEQSNLLTGTGTKLIIPAESGERLELRWTVDWLGEGRVIPRWLYALDYIRPDGRGGYLPPVRIGECHFSEGCNHGEFIALDENGNGVPDLFGRIVWESWDYGDDDGVAGYLDHVRHVYNRETDTYTVTRYLYRYPDGCRPPISPPEDVCRIKTACKPPYSLADEKILESRHLFPHGQTTPPEPTKK